MLNALALGQILQKVTSSGVWHIHCGYILDIQGLQSLC
jgi:hypothetical protein